MSVVSSFCQSSIQLLVQKFSAHSVTTSKFVVGHHFESPCAYSEVYASYCRNHAYEAWLHSAKVLNLALLLIVGWRLGTLSWHIGAYFKIQISEDLGRYLLSRDDGQVASTKLVASINSFQQYCSNDMNSEPSLHCVMTESNLPCFLHVHVATSPS